MMTTSSYRACTVSDLIAIREFRKQAYSADPILRRETNEPLVSDEWDHSSVHLGLLSGNNLIGTARFAYPINGRLPIHQFVPDLKISDPAYELSRGIIHPDHRNGVGVVIFSSFVYDFILANPANVLIDIVVGKRPSRARGHLLRMGLVDTGIRYWDDRYSAESAVLVGAKDVVVHRIRDYLWK